MPKLRLLPSQVFTKALNAKLQAARDQLELDVHEQLIAETLLQDPDYEPPPLVSDHGDEGADVQAADIFAVLNTKVNADR